MATIKKNFFFISILTTANYIFPFLTFPYISRVLGVNNIEISNQGDTRRLSVGLCVEAAGCGVMQGVHINNVYIHDVNGTYEEKTLPNGGLYYVVRDHSNNTRFDDIQVVNNIVKRVSRTGISVGTTSSSALWDGHGGNIPQEVLDAYGHTNVLI